MELETTMTWNLHLTTPELRLVLRSLGGRILDSAELAEAKALGDKITTTRGKRMKAVAADAERLLAVVPDDDQA